MTNKTEAKSELKGMLILFKASPSDRKAELLKRMVVLIKVIESAVKEFVKTVFKPAKSFDDFANKFSGKLFGQFGVSKNANLDVCNEAAEAMLDVNDRFDTGTMLDFFGNVKQSPFRGSKMPKNANAVYQRTRTWTGQLVGDGIMLPVSITPNSVRTQKALNNDMYNQVLFAFSSS